MMRWLGLIGGVVLALGAIPVAAKDKPPAPRICVVEHNLSSGAVSLTRSIAQGGATSDVTAIELPGIQLGAETQASLTLRARYEGRSVTTDPATSKVVIRAYVRDWYGGPKKGNYKLRLYGPAGPVDYPFTTKDSVYDLTMPLADFTARFGGRDMLDIAVITIYGDGSQREAPGHRFDFGMLRQREALLHSLRAALDALPPGPETSCASGDPNEVVTIRYNCSRMWSDAQGKYEVAAGSLKWTARVAPGLDILLSATRFRTERPGHGKLFYLGFNTTSDRPSGDYGQLWIGGHRAETYNKSTDLSDAMPGTVPLWVALTGPGMPERRIDLPPELFRDVVAKLFAEHARILANELAPVGRCAVSRSAADPHALDIVIT